jgi:protein SSD1
MYCDAIVIAVLDNAYDIFVPEYGIEKRLHLDRMALKKSTHNAANHTLILKWREDVTEMTEPEAETIYRSLEIEDDEDLDGLTEAIDEQLSLNGNDEQESSERSSQSVTESTVDDSQREDSSAQDNALEPPSSETDNGDGSALSEQQSAAQDSANDTQIIKVFGRVKIRLDVDMERTPPIINVHSVNPTIVV